MIHYNGMKLARDELKKMYMQCTDARDVEFDDDGQVVAFSFRRNYGKHNANRTIRVSLRASERRKKKQAIYLPEKEFFEHLYNNIERVTKPKLHCEKIVGYTLDGEKYETNKLCNKKLFDFFPYEDFLRVARQRFWERDDTLRNGYFSGLIGTHDGNIFKYQQHRDEYDVFDVDFNAAYPYCFKLPLPFGRFYTPDEWLTVRDKFKSYMRFFEVKIKTIPNRYNVFVPPPPFVEYADLDFLLTRSDSVMVISEYRLNLIRQIYGDNAFVVMREWFCATKIYVKLKRFAQKMYDEIQTAKADGDVERVLWLKVALNSLVGQFGRRDESRKIKGLKRVKNSVYSDVIMIEWEKPTWKRQPNYLPLAMVINDITARRLVDLLANPNVLRLSYNTDGAVVAIRKNVRIVTSKAIGRLKAERIIAPKFYYTSTLYNRPLVYDTATSKTYNQNNVIYDDANKRFLASETYRVNTGHGFIIHVSEYPVVIKDYRGFNFREQEIYNKIYQKDEYRKLRDVQAMRSGDKIDKEILHESARELYRLQHPFDPEFRNIRHAPLHDFGYVWDKDKLYYENFFKLPRKNA